MDKWKNHKHQYTWKSIAAGLSGVVAVLTIGAMTLPAIAMDNKCGLEEHRHTEACYVQGTDNQQEYAAQIAEGAQPMQNTEPEKSQGTEKILICQLPEHAHTEACRKKQEDIPAETVDAEEPTATAQTEPAEVQPSASELEEMTQEQESPKAAEETAAEPTETEPEETTDAASADVDDDDDDDDENTPIDVEQYVNKARLRYKDKASASGSDWKEMQEGVEIPGDANLRLDIEYNHVPIKRLINSGSQMSFQIPKIMRNPVAQGEIKDDSNHTVGTVTSAGHVITLAFEQSWLEELQSSNDGFLDGTFYVQSEINLSEVPNDGASIDIVFGDVHIKPTFGTDSIAQYGELTVKKAVSRHVIAENKDHFLEYTLTVTAGEDGSPDVKVVDQFVINGEYAEYVGITPSPAVLTSQGFPREAIAEGKAHGEIYQGAAPTDDQPIPPENGTEIVKPGSIVWRIGNMEANEQRILTYRVRLSDQQADKITNKPLRNRAEVFSKSFKKNDSVVDFTPKANLDMRKSHGAPVRDPEDGSHRLTYTVWFEALRSNNHVLGELTLTDSLKRTNEQILPYIRYDETSFKLYRSKRAEGMPIAYNKEDGSEPKLQFTEDKKEFTLSVGDMAAGEVYSIQYDVIVDAKAFGAANADQLTIRNRAEAKADNATLPGKNFIQGYQDDADISYKNWIQKGVSDPLAEDLTIDLPQSHVYDATGGNIVTDTAAPRSFKVPAGSYPYTVTFNRLGDWDITEAEISDTLSRKYVQYSGYLRVDAFNTKAQGGDPLGELVKTHWVKIDGLQSFRLRLTDIGFTDNSYAYRFTYHVTPVDTDSISKVNVGNSANIAGQVGKDGEEFQIGDFSSKVEITVQGGYSIQAGQEPWYHERANMTRSTWSKGAIHWGIKIDGTELREGTIIKNFVKNEHPHRERGKLYFREDSFVGIFKGKFPDGVQFNDYAGVQELANSGYVTQLPTNEYLEVTYKDELRFNQENTYSAVYMKMRKSVPLENGESIYLIVKTEPDPLPSGVRTKKVYTSYLDIGTSEDTMVNYGLAVKELYGGQNILKEFGTYFSFDGKKITNIKNGTHATYVPQANLKENGHYIAWASKVNYGGDLSGRYRVVDRIPKGTEIAFARLKWIGEETRDTGIQMAQIPNYKETLGADWTEHTIEAELDENLGSRTSYYYTNGDQVLWEVENLKAGHEMDVYAVDFQIVCRVTDPEVLQGGVEKEFVNQIDLYQTDGTHVDASSSGVRVSVRNIDKTADAQKNRVHFTIEVNQSGEDLILNGDTVTLVDEMSENLSLDVESIQVVNSVTKEPVSAKPALDGQTLMIQIPDDQALTITYTAHIHAVPDTNITLSNKAYWMGYPKQGGDSIVIEDFFYQIGGTAGGSGTPKVQILKYNQNDITEHLPGAQFRMEEGTMENGAFRGNGRVWVGTTGADGTITFGTGNHSGKAMQYNTVYQMRETRAPEGYVLDEEPHYFIIAKKVGDTYPEYPEGVHVHYASETHVYKAPNRKGEAVVEKRFENVDGTHIKPIPGQYHFGLFDNPEGSGKPLQTVILNFTETSSDQKGTFTDLNLDQQYYVFELDDAFQPIRAGAIGYVNGTPFDVSYQSDSGAQGHAVTNGSSITVTNKLCIDSLPETGGIGTDAFVFAGAMLMFSAVGMAFCQSQKRKNSN